MLISCKCLNFVANTSASRNNSIHQFDKNHQLSLINNRQQQQQQQRDRDAADSNAGNGKPISVTVAATAAAAAGDDNRCNDALTAELVNAFLQKYPRNCVFYSQCMELLKQSIGPISELSVTIHQRDLVCMLPCNSWILNICINCNTAICAKHATDSTYLLNSNLLISHDELLQRRADKSFSETFGILIMNQQQIDHQQHVDDNPFQINSNKTNNRLRSLTQNLQSRLQKEIADTDERIHRYTEQQFALLKSFREKSEQEYQILVSLVYQVPEQLIDAMGTGANNSVPTTPTITTPTKIDIGRLGVATATSNNHINNNNNNNNNSSLSAMDSSNTQATSAQSVFSFNNKKVASFDTPPATPESTPMSVGNSPTFNRQQQASIGLSSVVGGQRSSIGNGMFYINSSSSIASGFGNAMDGDGDCLFELEGIETYTMAPRSSIPQNMSDVEESAEDAEDALAELEAAIPIPGNHAKKQNNARDFARSLPIAIANSVNESTLITDSDDDVLEDNVDIAASIKALAKSVHGDAVFGDLPRPRLKSQI